MEIVISTERPQDSRVHSLTASSSSGMGAEMFCSKNDESADGTSEKRLRPKLFRILRAKGRLEEYKAYLNRFVTGQISRPIFCSYVTSILDESEVKHHNKFIVDLLRGVRFSEGKQKKKEARKAKKELRMAKRRAKKRSSEEQIVTGLRISAETPIENVQQVAPDQDGFKMPYSAPKKKKTSKASSAVPALQTEVPSNRFSPTRSDEAPTNATTVPNSNMNGTQCFASFAHSGQTTGYHQQPDTSFLQPTVEETSEISRRCVRDYQSERQPVSGWSQRPDVQGTFESANGYGTEVRPPFWNHGDVYTAYRGCAIDSQPANPSEGQNYFSSEHLYYPQVGVGPTDSSARMPTGYDAHQANQLHEFSAQQFQPRPMIKTEVYNHVPIRPESEVASNGYSWNNISAGSQLGALQSQPVSLNCHQRRAVASTGSRLRCPSATKTNSPCSNMVPAMNSQLTPPAYSTISDGSENDSASLVSRDQTFSRPGRFEVKQEMKPFSQHGPACPGPSYSSLRVVHENKENAPTRSSDEFMASSLPAAEGLVLPENYKISPEHVVPHNDVAQKINSTFSSVPVESQACVGQRSFLNSTTDHWLARAKAGNEMIQKEITNGHMYQNNVSQATVPVREPQTGSAFNGVRADTADNESFLEKMQMLTEFNEEFLSETSTGSVPPKPSNIWESVTFGEQSHMNESRDNFSISNQAVISDADTRYANNPHSNALSRSSSFFPETSDNGTQSLMTLFGPKHRRPTLTTEEMLSFLDEKLSYEDARLSFGSAMKP